MELGKVALIPQVKNILNILCGMIEASIALTTINF